MIIYLVKIKEISKKMTEATNQFTDLRLLKETYIIAAQAIDKMKEPSNELSILAEALMEAITLNRTVIQQEFATFLYEDLAPGLAKRLHKERSNDETVSRFLINLISISELWQMYLRTLSGSSPTN